MQQGKRKNPEETVKGKERERSVGSGHCLCVLEQRILGLMVGEVGGGQRKKKKKRCWRRKPEKRRKKERDADNGNLGAGGWVWAGHVLRDRHGCTSDPIN